MAKMTKMRMLMGMRAAARSRLLAVCKNAGFPYLNDERTPVIGKRLKMTRPELWDGFIDKFDYSEKDISEFILGY